MFFRGLKAKIALNIAVLLLAAMLLMVLVVMVTVKRELLRSEVNSANIMLASIEEDLSNVMMPGEAVSGLIPKSFITKMIDDSQISRALVLGAKGERCYLGSKSKISMDELYGFTQKAMYTGEKKIHFMDTSWILFWKLDPRMVVATPLVKEGRTLGGGSVSNFHWTEFTTHSDDPNSFYFSIYSSI